MKMQKQQEHTHNKFSWKHGNLNEFTSEPLSIKNFEDFSSRGNFVETSFLGGRIIILSFFILVSVFCKGQVNLVPNYSFEDTSYCVTGSGEMPAALGWNSYLNSPDYFNPCTQDPNVSVPYNWGGYQLPYDGIAYSALGTFQSNSGGVDLREFIGRQLSTTLTIGTKYFVSFRVNLSISSTILANCATNNLGASFSTIPYHWVTNPAPITNAPKVFSPTIITDTLGWTLITGSFIADSAYSYVMLGNFFDDANTDTLLIDGSFSSNCFAYYYIDDVCVSTDSLLCNSPVGVNELSLNPDLINIFPNPVRDYLNICNVNEQYDLTIFNSFGRVVYDEKAIGSNCKSIPASSFDSGVLIICITTKKKSFYYKVIKI